MEKFFLYIIIIQIMLACLNEFKIWKKNAGNKIIWKQQWLLMNHVGVCENITAARRSKIYTFDRVDVCD